MPLASGSDDVVLRRAESRPRRLCRVPGFPARQVRPSPRIDGRDSDCSIENILRELAGGAPR